MNGADVKPEAGTLPQDAGIGSLLRLLERPIPEGALEENAAAAAAPADESSRGKVGVLLFRLGDEVLALPARHLRRILGRVRPTSIPHRSSPILRGLCNIRGELIPCGDLARLLSLPDRVAGHAAGGTGSDAERMVVVGPASASWVFEVDRIDGVDRIDPAALAPAPMTVGHSVGSYVSGLMEHEGRRVAVLDVERVLAGLTGTLA